MKKNTLIKFIEKIGVEEFQNQITNLVNLIGESKEIETMDVSAELENFIKMYNEIVILGNTGKNLYEKFSDYSKDEVDQVIAALNEDYKRVLQRAYGKEYNCPRNITGFDKQDLTRYYNTIAKMKKLLQGKIKIANTITLYEKFSDYSKDEVDQVIAILNEDYKKVLQRAYGKEYNCPRNITEFDKQEVTRYYSAIAKMKKLLQGKIKIASTITLYEKFSEYSKEEIDRIIVHLNTNQKRILQKVYGDDYSRSKDMTTLDKQEVTRYYSAIAKMKKLLQGKMKITSPITLYEKFSEYSKEEIDQAIARLNEDYKKILQKVYGVDYSKPKDLSQLTDKRLKVKYQSAISRLKYLLENPTLKKHAKAISKNRAPKKKRTVTRNSRTAPILDSLNKLSAGKNLYEHCPNCSKEIVDLALNYIAESAREKLLIFFGGDYSNCGNDKFVSKQGYYQAQRAYDIFRRSLTKTIKEEAKKIHIKSRKNDLIYIDRINLFEYFSSYTKIQIVFLFAKGLNKEYKNILRKVCGDTLNQISGEVALTDEELETFKISLNNLENLLKENARKQNPIEVKVKLIPLFQYFPEFSNEQIEWAVKQLDEELYKKLLYFYGEDFYAEHIIYISYKEEKQIKNILEFITLTLTKNSSIKSKSKVNRQKNISMVAFAHDLFNVTKNLKESLKTFEQGLSKFMVGEAIELTKFLDSEDLALLKIAYGDNFENNLNPSLDDEQVKHLAEIFVHLKYIYKTKNKRFNGSERSKTLSQLVGITNSQLVIAFIYDNATEFELELLKIAFGESLFGFRDDEILNDYEITMINKFIKKLKQNSETIQGNIMLKTL